MAERTETLLSRERELRSLADNTPDILTRFDRDLRYVFVNIGDREGDRAAAGFVSRAIDARCRDP